MKPSRVKERKKAMSLSPRFEYPVPDETARGGRAIFAKGNLDRRWYDTVGMLLADEDCRALFPQAGQPGLSAVRLSRVLRRQYGEGVSGRQAADAVRTRMDWKSLLGLELTDVGFQYRVLSECRDRLQEGSREPGLFEKRMDQLNAHQLLKVGGQQRTDSSQVLGAIRSLNRRERVVETMRQARNTLAIVACEWPYARSQVEWVERYGDRASEYRLPTSEAERRV
jgi:transposase